MPATNVDSIKLVLVEDHAMFRQCLAKSLNEEPDFQVVGMFGKAADALPVIASSEANLILLDVDLGGERALDFVAECKHAGFKGHMLILTAGTTGQEAVQLVQAGVSGIVHKYHSTQELCKTIRQVAAGEVYLEPEYFSSLYRSMDRSKTQDRPTLTERDKVVLRYIFQGLSNRDIGTHLNISESGVKSSLRQLFDKLGVRTRAQLVKIALEQYRDQL